MAPEGRAVDAVVASCRWLPAASLASACLLVACTGIFQRSLPDRLAEFRVLAAGPDLKVGAAERDITPEDNVYMGGFSLARTSAGIASRLKVRAMVIELGGERFALIGIDNLGVMREDVDWLKSGLGGCKNGCVFIGSSHTHAGPDLIGLWGFYFLSSGRDRAYVARLRQCTSEAVAEACANAAPAEFVLGGERLPPDGLVGNSKRHEVFDRRITVLQARAKDDGHPLGTLLHMACHPEVLRRGNSLLSADYVGELCEAWKAAGHGQAVFLNGALGAMVTPGIKQRDPAGMHQMGLDLCALAEKALAAAAPLPVPEIEVQRRDVFVPVETLGFRLGRLTTVVQREMYEGRARSTVGYLRLGALEAVGVPGEMEPVNAERLRARSGRPELLVFGLCDDELGYLLREQDARDPVYRYEHSMSPCTLAGDMVVNALVGK